MHRKNTDADSPVRVILTDTIGPVRVLQLNDAERRNPLTPEIADTLLHELLRAESEPGIRALVISGVGPVFCAGGDLGSMPPSDPAAARERLGRYERLVLGFRASPLPLVSAVNGAAAGIGAALALAADIVVLDANGRILLPFTRLGLAPDGGLTRTLSERIGAGRARALLLLAEPIDAETALTLGIVDRIAAPGNALAEATHLAQNLAERASGSVAAVKELFADLTTMGRTFAGEADAQTQRYFSAEFAVGKLAFANRIPPVFPERTPPTR